jgi:hypothetical protein
MKTKRSPSFLVILIYILLGLTSCEEEVMYEKPPIDDPKNITKYTIEAFSDSNGTVTPEKAEVTAGSNVKFTFHLNPGYRTSYILINGEKVTNFTPGETTYWYSNITSDFYLEVVNERDPRFPSLMCDERGWIEDSVYIYTYKTEIWSIYKSDRPWITYYYLDGSHKTYSNGELIGNSGAWYIDPSTTPATFHEAVTTSFPQGVLSEIERLDEEAFIIYSDSVPDWDDATKKSFVRVVFKHPK